MPVAVPAAFHCRRARRLRAFCRALGRLVRARRGAVAAEFAMVIPVLALIALGGTEIARYALLHQKLARAAVTMADLVSQAEDITEGGITQLLAATEPVMQPFGMGADGVVILSSITASGGNPARISWQRSGGGGLTGAGSNFGVEGGTATLPPGFVVRDGETAIAAEVFYAFSPLFTAGLVPIHVIYQRALFRPRFGSLAAVAP